MYLHLQRYNTRRKFLLNDLFSLFLFAFHVFCSGVSFSLFTYIYSLFCAVCVFPFGGRSRLFFTRHIQNENSGDTTLLGMEFKHYIDLPMLFHWEMKRKKGQDRESLERDFRQVRSTFCDFPEIKFQNQHTF